MDSVPNKTENAKCRTWKGLNKGYKIPKITLYNLKKSKGHKAHMSQFINWGISESQTAYKVFILLAFWNNILTSSECPRAKNFPRSDRESVWSWDHKKMRISKGQEHWKVWKLNKTKYLSKVNVETEKCVSFWWPKFQRHTRNSRRTLPFGNFSLGGN